MTDPILAAIERHRAAWDAYCDVLNETAGARFMSKREARRHAARDAHHAETERLTSITIASPAGLTAFLTYLSDYATRGMGLRKLDALAWWDLADALRQVQRALGRFNRAPPRRVAAHSPQSGALPATDPTHGDSHVDDRSCMLSAKIGRRRYGYHAHTLGPLATSCGAVGARHGGALQAAPDLGAPIALRRSRPPDADACGHRPDGPQR